MNGIWNKNMLIAALAIQVAAVAVLIAVKSGGAVEPAPFLDFDATAVDAISVANVEGDVALAKEDDAWQLPDGLPADAAKVQGVIDKLADAGGGWPVATSASVQERFELTEENHQRRLTLSAAGETVADIYLGTSPGYRKVHARRVGADDIYAITFSNYEAGVKAADWLDKSLLRPNGPLTGLRYAQAAFDPPAEDGPAPLFALAKDEEGVWSAESGASLDQAKVETLAGRFTGLTVTGVSEVPVEDVLADPAEQAPPDAPPDGEDGEEDATAEDAPDTPVKMVFALSDDAGAATLTIRRINDNYVATSDRVAGVYKVSSYIAEQMHTTLPDLAPDQAEAAADESEDEEEDSAPDTTAEAP